MKIKVVNPVRNTFSRNTLVICESRQKIVLCTKDVNELTFNGIVLHDDAYPNAIGNFESFIKDKYSLFTGEITLSN